MEVDSFLKKFQGRTEVIGRQGILGIMNNVHINVNDYQIPNKKQKNIKGRRKSSPKDEYNYVQSEISKEFNENKNFIPQLKSLSLSSKIKNNKDNMNNNKKNINIKNSIKEENNKNNKKANNNLALTNENKKKNYNTIDTKNKVSNHINKPKEKPIKIYKYEDQKKEKEKTVNQKQNKNENNNNNKNEIKYSDKNRKKSPENNKNNNNSNNTNKLKESRSKSKNNISKNNIKLPPIALNSASPKSIKKNFISKSQKLNINKNYKRVNTYTPALKINNNNSNNYNNENETENKSKSLKEIISQKIKIGKIKSDSLSLPKIIINKQKEYNSPNQKMNNQLYNYNNNKQKNDNNDNITNGYNVLENIKKDFLFLDSIKNRSNTDRNNKTDINEMEYNSINIDKNNIKLIYDNINKNKKNNFLNRNNKNDPNLNNNNSYSFNKKNNNMNSKFNLYNNNNEIPLYNDVNNINSNNIKNRYNINNNDNEVNLGSSERKKPHTSFDLPQIIPGLKQKLDIISEEDEDDNKYITDLNINNNFGIDGNLNTLEILMKQRMFFQNKMPNNSRFKLKQINE